MFQAPKLTDAGKNLYYKNMSGVGIKFTTIQLGNGALSTPIATMTALVSTVVTIDADVDAKDQYAEISGCFSNAGLEKGFYWKEIGVFAEDPDHPGDRSRDILYCYQNAYDTPDFIPVASVETVEKDITVPVIVGDVSSVSCTIDKSLVYASAKDLNNHADNKDNPHGVTAEQVGARPDSWMPTAEEVGADPAGSASDVRQHLDDHATDRSNPHNVTIAQVGGVNPNLLDNWYFADPINQREQNSYSGAFIYGFDRWVQNDLTLTNSVNGVAISNRQTDPKIYQLMQPTDATRNSVLTVSFLTDKGLVVATGKGIFSFTSSFAEVSGGVITSGPLEGLQYFKLAPKMDLTVIAAKAELGPIQTLAHQEGGTWILNEIPNKGLELMKCQRFWNKLDLNAPMFTSADSTSKGQPILLLQYPKMIHTPTITIVGSPGANVQFSSSDACVVKGTNDGGRQYVTILELDADL